MLKPSVYGYGYDVSEDPEAGSCPFIEEYDYTYTKITYKDGGQQPESITGPWGNEWMFKDPQVFEADHPEWYNEYISTSEA
jgi:hypothetical protein